MPSGSLQSFPPVYRSDARILILGSMPGKASLRAEHYYAHPRNAFWRIMAALYDVDDDAEFLQRYQTLMDHRVALWDVLRSCVRDSSLDSDIIESSIVPNDIPGLLSTCPDIQLVCFNGAKAEQAFRRYVLQDIAEPPQLLRLPSTSPAHAAMPFQQKLDAWREITSAAQALATDETHSV